MPDELCKTDICTERSHSSKQDGLLVNQLTEQCSAISRSLLVAGCSHYQHEANHVARPTWHKNNQLSSTSHSESDGGMATAVSTILMSAERETALRFWRDHHRHQTSLDCPSGAGPSPGEVDLDPITWRSSASCHCLLLLLLKR